MTTRLLCFIFFFVAATATSSAQAIAWTGGAGNELWAAAGNWSGNQVPSVGEDVVLDNRAAPGSYRVVLPDDSVRLRSVHIVPSSGQSIELLLPATNKNPDALVLSGHGYPLLVGSGGIFRNASGISSGESIQLADSLRIEDGGRYVHGTRASHAASLVARLSVAPGTEKGIFEFDVPRASYTISASNRVYGSLVLQASSYGQPVNYTCTGSNGLYVRGDLRIGAGVSFSIDLATEKGNVRVDGDFVQEDGSLNLGSGKGNTTRFLLAGNLSQSPGAIITSSPEAFPWLELDGILEQEINAAGSIAGNAGFRLRNPAGMRLLAPLSLPYRFHLETGVVYSGAAAVLTLGPDCILTTDSTKTTGTYVDGPLQRLKAAAAGSLLFPVGRNGSMRWLGIKDASGDFTAEYFAANPAFLGGSDGAGIDHVSREEYWKLLGGPGATGRIELSHASPQSGGITDPVFLRVAAWRESVWSDEGQSGVTGDFIRGSVISNDGVDFTANYFTLASSVDVENPLPLLAVSLRVVRDAGVVRFAWKTDDLPGSTAFELFLAGAGHPFHAVCRRSPEANIRNYEWSMRDTLGNSVYSARLDLIDPQGGRKTAAVVSIPVKTPGGPEIHVVSSGSGDGLSVQAERPGEALCTIYDLAGALRARMKFHYAAGYNFIRLPDGIGPPGYYVVKVVTSTGKVSPAMPWIRR